MLPTACALAIILTQSPAPTIGAQPYPPLEEIIERAIQREEAIDATRYGKLWYEFDLVLEWLDRDRKVKKTQGFRYDVFPIEGHPYSRLVERDGRGLNPKQMKKELKRERRFRENITAGNDPYSHVGEDEIVKFDRDLADRYVSTFDGVEELNGRPTYVIRYRPVPGKKLPQRRRIDRALNNSSGRILIDTETYTVAAIEFDLMHKIRIWWGFFGSIKELTGRIATEPLDPERPEGVWFPATFELYMDGRVLFKSLHCQETIRWSNVRPALPDAAN